MRMQFNNFAVENLADGQVTPEEIQVLRQLGWADGKMDPDEAEALFAIHDSLVDPNREWCDFFVEALSNFIVNTVKPQGHVDQEMADELIARIDRDGRLNSLAELELLVRVLEIATSAPAMLRSYALQQIELSVEQGEGPTRHGDLGGDGINSTEVDLLRRLIFPARRAGAATVCSAEVDMLFRIKDATLYEANARQWQALFVQGVASYLLGFANSEALSTERAHELEAFMHNQGAEIGGFLSRIVTRDGADAFGSLLNNAEVEMPDLEEGADWLRHQLEADEELDELEKALIAFIDAETGATFVPRPKALAV